MKLWIKRALVALANELDEHGLTEESDQVDSLVNEERPSGGWFHMSAKDFGVFEQQFKGGRKASEPGFHFGSKELALIVAHKLKLEGRVKSGDTVYLYAVDLDVSNPVRLKENRLGSWSVTSIIKELFEGFDGDAHPEITEEEVDSYYEDEILLESGENLKDMWSEYEEFKGMAQWMREKGWDSIIYNNEYEGGGDSLIVFDPSKIRIKSKEEWIIP
jgi:hypothetical protein